MREIFFGREHRIGCTCLLGIPGTGQVKYKFDTSTYCRRLLGHAWFS